MKTVLLGMSGGVDSTVSSSVLKDLGYDVTGVYFIMHSTHLAGVDEAKRAAADCGVPLVVKDLREEFRKHVTDVFAAEYLSGRTPNPCVCCNRHIKFPYLLACADELGIEYIATGHYAAVKEANGRKYIARPKDIKKDQSYFLYPLTEDIRSRLVLPLCDMTKDEVRAYAGAHGFAAAVKHDSQDICFIPDGDSGCFVKEYANIEAQKGDFIGQQGKVFGRHNGIFNYTVGQRRGLGIAADAPLYVLEIRPGDNTILLGYENELYKTEIKVGNCIFADKENADAGFDADVCIRYSKKCSKARITPLGDGTCSVVFDTPQRGPAPGQSAVFYEDDRVIGGGIIL